MPLGMPLEVALQELSAYKNTSSHSRAPKPSRTSQILQNLFSAFLFPFMVSLSRLLGATLFLVVLCRLSWFDMSVVYLSFRSRLRGLGALAPRLFFSYRKRTYRRYFSFVKEKYAKENLY